MVCGATPCGSLHADKSPVFGNDVTYRYEDELVRVHSSEVSRLSRSLVDDLRQKIEADQFEFSKHAVDQSIVRRISLREMREAIASGEIIEEYPEDKYWPSYLIYGTTAEGRPLHVQCSHPSRQLVKVVTLYEPDPARWIDFRERRSS